MNERIKELWDKVDIQEEGNPPSIVITSERELQEFAELIVRECIDKIETYRIPVGNSPAGEMACKWTYDALEEIRADIKETFGVE